MNRGNIYLSWETIQEKKEPPKTLHRPGGTCNLRRNMARIFWIDLFHMRLAKSPGKVFVEWKVKCYVAVVVVGKGLKLATWDNSGHCRQKKQCCSTTKLLQSVKNSSQSPTKHHCDIYANLFSISWAWSHFLFGTLLRFETQHLLRPSIMQVPSNL